MSGFVGICNLKKDLLNNKNIIQDMNMKLQKKKQEKEEYFIDKNINLGSRKLIISNSKETIQLMSIKYANIVYTIVYNGQIYNKSEIKKELRESGYKLEGNSDTEVLLKAFIHYGINVLHRLNGIFSFAIWNDYKKELILVRDHFGIKPLYYTVVDNTIIFATEIKAILAYPNIEVTIDKRGLCELFGLRTCSYSGDRNI